MQTKLRIVGHTANQLPVFSKPWAGPHLPVGATHCFFTTLCHGTTRGTVVGHTVPDVGEPVMYVDIAIPLMSSQTLTDMREDILRWFSDNGWTI